VLENAMLDVMYDIPSQDLVKEVLINEDVIVNGKSPIMLYDVAESA
jgi:ATP-dependent Clp protease ATP-binding subunit ClpX